jgi:hypothetical protein
MTPVQTPLPQHHGRTGFPYWKPLKVLRRHPVRRHVGNELASSQSAAVSQFVAERYTDPVLRRRESPFRKAASRRCIRCAAEFRAVTEDSVVAQCVVRDVLTELILFVAGINRTDNVVVTISRRSGEAAHLPVAHLVAVAESSVVAQRVISLMHARSIHFRALFLVRKHCPQSGLPVHNGHSRGLLSVAEGIVAVRRGGADALLVRPMSMIAWAAVRHRLPLGH